MAGARAKPKCDIVGGKRLPDLKSLQAGKSKRRKLQEKKKYLQSKDATSGDSPQQNSNGSVLSQVGLGRSPGSRRSEPAGSRLRLRKKPFPHKSPGEKTNVFAARAQQEQHRSMVPILRITKLHAGNNAAVRVPASSKLTLPAPRSFWVGDSRPRSPKKQQLRSASSMSRLGSWLLLVVQGWVVQANVPSTGSKTPAGSFAKASTRDAVVLVTASSRQALGCLCFWKTRIQTSRRPPAKPLPRGIWHTLLQ